MGNKVTKPETQHKTKQEANHNNYNEAEQNHDYCGRTNQSKQTDIHNNKSTSENSHENPEGPKEHTSKISTSNNSDNSKSTAGTKEESKSTCKSLEALNIDNIHEAEAGKKDKIYLKTVAGSLFQDIRKVYKFKEVLGGGHFGTVRVAYKRSDENKRKYAIKSISKNSLSEKDLEDLI